MVWMYWESLQELYIEVYSHFSGSQYAFKFTIKKTIALFRLYIHTYMRRTIWIETDRYDFEKQITAAVHKFW